MIYRTFEASLHNAIANFPTVFDRIAPDGEDGPLSFDQCAAQPHVFVLLHNDEDAAMIFQQTNIGVWEVHVMFLPSCRGKRALEVGREMFAYMFNEKDAIAIWAQVPLKLRDTRWFSRQLGGLSQGNVEHQLVGECELFLLTKERWEERTR